MVGKVGGVCVVASCMVFEAVASDVAVGKKLVRLRVVRQTGEHVARGG